MRQHIQPSDLDQLTPAGKEKLRAWWKPSISDVLFRPNNPPGLQEVMGFIGETPIKEECYPLLNIGQMIEFLCDEGKNFSMGYDRNPSMWSFVNGKWWPNAKGETKSGEDYYELCNALWSATKEILNHEHN